VGETHGLAEAEVLARRLPADSGERDTFLGNAAQAAAKTNLDDALLAATNAKLLASENVAGALAEAVARARGVESAITWVKDNVPDSAQIAAYTTIANVWAETDPAGAAKWAHTLSDTGPLNQVLSTWGDQDLPAAVAWINGNTTAEEQVALMPSAFDSWSSKKPLEATKLAVTQLSPEAAHAVLPSLASPVATDPANDPAAWYAALPAGLQAPEVRVALATGWIGRDPAATIAWLQKNTPPADFDDTWKQVVQQWAVSDSADLDKWLKDQPPGALRDAAVTAYANELAFSDVDSAKKMAAQLSDPAAQAALLKEIDATAAAIQKQLSAGGTPGLIFLDQNGKPLESPPQGLSIQVQGGGAPAGNGTAPAAAGN
jgi:hypothetical protein